MTLRRIGYFITLDSSLVNNLGDFKDEWGASKELHKFIYSNFNVSRGIEDDGRI